jgi:DNA polymerase-3 subunit delta'
VLRKVLYLKTQNIGRKIVLVFDAHLLNSGQGEAANAFLKILEEPPLNTTIILVTDYMELLLPTILSRCQKIAFPKLNNEYLEEWCSINKVKKAHAPLVIGLSEGDVHKAKILISQPLEKTMSSISSLIKVISEKDPGQWRKLINTYSRYSKQNKPEFNFHFNMLKIWFQAANRLTKNIDHILHKTSFIEDMKIFIKRNPNADFSSIIYELEKPMEAVKNNYYMPLVLINLLLKIQKHFKQ